MFRAQWDKLIPTQRDTRIRHGQQILKNFYIRAHESFNNVTVDQLNKVCASPSVNIQSIIYSISDGTLVDTAININNPSLCQRVLFSTTCYGRQIRCKLYSVTIMVRTNLIIMVNLPG